MNRIGFATKILPQRKTGLAVQHVSTDITLMRFDLGASLTAVLGPTNTGKTHLAVERMCGHVSGMIGFPLRLLAREVYDRVVAIKGKAQVALITGEEKILPEGARYFLCTAESMPTDRDVAFVALDEGQMGADRERGHVFTNRILTARGFAETMILGSETLRPLIRQLLPDADIITRPRFSTLGYSGAKKLSRLPRRSAVVAFSAEDVYALAEMLRRHRGGAAVVMGSLSPRTRNAQVELYQSGEVDYLVATDAIGMGLNLDVSHVAFAGLSKFDGQRHRRLTVSEMAQIAGRAGRHQRDGTFGTVQLGAEGESLFDPAEIEAIEDHDFDPLTHLQWRNARLDWRSVPALIASLELHSDSPVLHRAMPATDLLVLKRLAAEDWVGDRAKTPGAVRRLWDICGLPDYRKTGAETHARVVGRMYRHLSEGSGHLPTEWIAREVAQLDNLQGDIGQLGDRIAAARTWTYVAHRSDWLADTAEWRERTRTLENRLSDALHERLTSRFVDRRTSVLLREIGGRAADLVTQVDEDGTVAVEGEAIGQLHGFRFTVDATARLSEKKMLLAAAERRLPQELARRAKELVEDANAAFTLHAAKGTGPGIVWRGHRIARLERGRDKLHPRPVLDRALDALPAELRQAVTDRVKSWLSAEIGQKLRPLAKLVELAADKTQPATVRGIAVRLIDGVGVIERRDVDDLVTVLPPEGRRILSRAGVRFGTLDLFTPQLLKPEATRWRLALWAAARGKMMTDTPAAGAVTFDLRPQGEDNMLKVSGFRGVGDQAVRIDLIERVAEAAHSARQGRRPFLLDPSLAVSIGCRPGTLSRLMQLLGFREQTADGGAAAYIWRGPRRQARQKPPPSSASPFAVLAELGVQGG